MEAEHRVCPNREPIGCLGPYPIIEVTRVEGDQAVVEECPICGDTHYHGFDHGIGAISKQRSSLSLRARHCGSDAPPETPEQYWLIYTQNTNNVSYNEELGGWDHDR